MRNRRISLALATFVAIAGCGLAPAALASDIYFKFELGGQYATGEPDGFLDLDALALPLTGSDTDSSSIYGLGAGLEVPLPELLPWTIDLPGWTARLETSLIFGLDWEFRTDASVPDEFVFTDTKSPVSWLNTLSVNIPIYRPMARLFRPFSALKPISFYAGAGLGLAYMEIEAYGPGTSRGSTKTVTFAYQAVTGFSYAVTSRVSLSLGYRYLNLGSPEGTLEGGGINPSDFELKLDSHGFDAGLRVKFYSVDFPGSLWEQMLE